MIFLSILINLRCNMKRINRSFFAILWVLTLCSTPDESRADTDSATVAFVPLSSDLVSGPNPLPGLGDTVFLALTFRSNIDGTAILRNEFSSLLAPPDVTVLEEFRDSSLAVEKDSTYTVMLPLQVDLALNS